MPSLVYQYVINLVVILPIRRVVPGVLMKVSVREYRALNKQILWCVKIYYSNSIIINILM